MDTGDDEAIFLPASLSAELLDPFRTHPETRVPGINVLLKHCENSALLDTSTPVSAKLGIVD